MFVTPFDEIVARLTPCLGSGVVLLPRKWEKLGTVLVLRFPEELRGSVDEICKAYAEVLGCMSVLDDVGGIAGQHRVPQVKHLWGSQETVTVHHENGIRYKLDPRQVMFSSGNMAERIRMGTVVRDGEIIVDMFAGIGYFTLPMAVTHKPARIYACEINPAAYGFLNQNIVLNNVTEIVTPLLGDNRTVAPRGVADRVILGYLEDTDQYFSTAIECLCNHEGLVHYHEAAPTVQCPDRPLQTLTRIAKGFDRNLRLVSWREIKSYAPGISHVVLDLEVTSGG
jgi:tRNA wybutosine-synthesizing protein 2